MGRYYHGDIEGKFWFAVQSSDSASRFSKDAECEHSVIPYMFTEEHLDDIQNELKAIELKLGDSLQKFDDFFSANEGYNSQMLIDANLPVDMLSDYADYGLGKKIEKCVIDNGECFFEAEL